MLNNKHIKSASIEYESKNIDVKRRISPRKKHDYSKDKPTRNNSLVKNNYEEIKHLLFKDKLKDRKSDNDKKDSKNLHRSYRRCSCSSASSSSILSHRSRNGSKSNSSIRRIQQSKKKDDTSN